MLTPGYTPVTHPSTTWLSNPECIPSPLPATPLSLFPVIFLLSLVPQRRFPSSPSPSSPLLHPLGDFSLPSRNQWCTGVLIPTLNRLLMEVLKKRVEVALGLDSVVLEDFSNPNNFMICDPSLCWG